MIIVSVTNDHSVDFRHLFHLDRRGGVSSRADPLRGRASMGEDAGVETLGSVHFMGKLKTALTDQRAICNLVQKSVPLE